MSSIRVIASIGTVLVAVAATPFARAQTLTVLYSFPGNQTVVGDDGGLPSAGVIRGSGGDLYGTTLTSGTYGWGTVFKVSQQGVETVVHSFTGKADGANLTSGLIRDSKGNLYGAALTGGSSGCGTVFRINTAGKLSVLHSFTYSSDGCDPSDVIRDSAGNLYGSTYVGGGSVGSTGTVYKIDTTGMATVLYSFTGGADGAVPGGPLVRDESGNLYGETYAGGSGGFGTVFKVDTNGKETVLHAFAGGADGANPGAGLVRDSSGNLYGTTMGGGLYNLGAVFRVDSNGNNTVLHSFGLAGDPYLAGGLIQDSAGNLYGTSSYGGTYGGGTVYEIDPLGNETVLYSFTGGLDGKYANGRLARDAQGNLYGTAQAGGASVEWGTVFKLKP